MKKNIIKLSLAFFVLLVATSCKKNSSSKSKTELLTQKTWILANLETKSGTTWQVDEEFAAAEACEKDDQTIFKVDRTFEQNDGALKCDDSSVEQGSWDFADDETKLVIEGEKATITQLDENTLVITGSTIGIDPATIDYRATFKH